ncbi:MAG TPA: hypothetical protein VF121_02100 [Thermoanaerobaculia bacterium]|nr:hypothetical protein [Thermoanaerobaculia bacterium]
MNRTLLAVAALLAAAAAHAQPTVEVEELRCLPAGRNGLVRATAANEPAGGSARLQFRWRDHGEIYWLDLEPGGGGRWWGVLPKPEKRNQEVEYSAALVDAGGAVVARSATRYVKVNGNCPVELSPRETGVAENLTVGESAPQQQGKTVMGFLCDGIVTRVNHAGIRRADETCRSCVIAWWARPSVLFPAGVGGILIIDEDPEPEPSPSRP